MHLLPTFPGHQSYGTGDVNSFQKKLNLPYRADLEKGNVISTAFGVQETFDGDWRKKVSTHFKTSMELQSWIKLLT